MRKCLLVTLILTGVAAAQWLPFRRDRVDAQRAALHEKLTRLASTRQSLTALELASVPASGQLASKDLLSLAEAETAPCGTVAPQRARSHVVAVEKPPAPHATVGASRNPAPAVPITTDLAPPARTAATYPITTDDPAASAKQDVSLGEIARQYRARKRQKDSTSH